MKYNDQIITKPHYIGITGFTRRGQIEWVLNKADTKQHVLMAGVLLSDKTWQGISNKYPNRYPQPQLIKDIWCPGAFNVLHYHTDDYAMPRLEDIIDTCEIRAGMGLQLNVVWPDPERVAWLRDQDIAVILQISRRALEVVSGNVDQLLTSLATYAALDYVLFDLSAGQGVDLNSAAVIQYVMAVAQRFPDWNIVLAGGLGHDTVGNVRSFAFLGPFSVDAETRLRDGTDRLTLAKCVSYINTATRTIPCPVS